MNVKKVGILTSVPSFINNYGAILQAYALSTQIRKNGVEPYIIKYAGNNEYVQGRISTLRRIKGTVLNSKMSVRARTRLVINKLTDRSVLPAFKKFQDEEITFFNKEYIDYAGLTETVDKFDAFIVGSDQVWNPWVHNGVNDPGYFLAFATENVKKIAYAPSMGVNELPDTCKTNLKEYLEHFDSLSIREKSGQKIIRDVCDMEVPVVLDPTLLLTAADYDKIKTVPNRKAPYIVYYKFGKIKSVENTVRKIAEKYGYEIVCVPAGLETRFSPDYSIGPREFIGLISNAALVCTDSFHASVFSIIYNRPFIAFCRDEEYDGSVTMNSRITGLLELLDLKEAWAGNGTGLDIERLPVPDYKHANELLTQRRQEAIDYLKKSMDIYE